jgi:hypothetical protein
MRSSVAAPVFSFDEQGGSAVEGIEILFLNLTPSALRASASYFPAA